MCIRDSYDTLVISKLGYKTKFIPINKIKGRFVKVNMNEQIYALPEVSIHTQATLKELLVKVVKHIPQNYPSQKHRLKGYYQEFSASFDSYQHYLDAYITVENQSYEKGHPLTKSKADETVWPSPYSKVWLHHSRRSDDLRMLPSHIEKFSDTSIQAFINFGNKVYACLLYTSPSPRDATLSRMPSSA